MVISAVVLLSYKLRRVAPLELDLTDPLRTFELRARLTVGAETFALVGPTGAGKSTILRAVAG